MSKPLYCPCTVYLPLNARSECVAPSDFPVGGVVEIMFMFQAAWPASHHPALRPTRGSGVGTAADTIGSAGRGIVLGGGGGGGAGVAAGCAVGGGVAGAAAAGGCAGAAAGGGEVFEELAHDVAPTASATA